ncbi:embryo-specific protein ATS3B [Prosopis cineraria]|uniref:embryo-specific protein ATS3B n=1 Tax=Prosopis cineraria TaxID=364024 RepID=UPI0024109929|nr:embryo-specific protein ATS3B [Prosopis cineraria]
MMKTEVFLLLLLAFGTTLSVAEFQSSTPQLHAAEFFNVSYIQMKNVGSCPYTVIISTSCSSPVYTRDQISISFGDAYGNQIYVPRLDDPSSKAFERCSSDTFQINGPCAYQICYVYLCRTGPDGWKPRSVQIYGHNTRAVTFNYNTFIPPDTWYGFNLCNAASSSRRLSSEKWFLCVVLGFVLSFWM